MAHDSWWRNALRRVVPVQRGGLVVVYHRVAHLKADLFGQAIRPETFERQLQILQRFGTIVPVSQIVSQMMLGQPVRRLIGVSFDDGYVDNLTTAAPIAARFGVPITVFVTTQPVFDGMAFWWDRLAAAVLQSDAVAGGTLRVDDLTMPVRSEAERVACVHAIHALLRGADADRREALLRTIESQCRVVSVSDADRPMHPDELDRLAALPHVEVGAHTTTHPSLAALTSDEQHSEMAESRSALEGFLGRSVRLLAYPFGKADNVSNTTRQLARSAGFDAAFTTIPCGTDAGADVYGLPRLTVHEWTDDEFTARIAALVGPPNA